MMMSDRTMEAKVRDLIKRVLKDTRDQLSKSAQSAMNSDPRQAYRAVRNTVYRQILGGNVNILRKRRASAGGGKYEPTRTLRSNQRGGNRRARSGRTKNLESYWGSDRGFILRFINAGTNDRAIKDFVVNENRKVYRGNRHPNTGFRGRITATNWFGNRSEYEMQHAAKVLSEHIDRLIEDVING